MALSSLDNSTSTILVEEVLSFLEAQERERALLDRVGKGTPDTAAVLVWRTEPAIIVPRGLPHRDTFARAAAAVEALGVPVFERDTGGDLTPQDPGIVNLSLAFRMDGEGAAIKDAYLRLTAPVLAYLRDRHGIEAHLSAIPGAFCDGAYNVAIGDRKIAGTAQRWKLLGGEGKARRLAVLAHVALMVSNPLDPAIEALNVFYEASGSARRIVRERHVTLAEMVGKGTIDAESIARDLALFLAGMAAGA